jgi:hypothetical protein
MVDARHRRHARHRAFVAGVADTTVWGREVAPLAMVLATLAP